MVNITKATAEEFETVLIWVQKLLDELGDESDEFDIINKEKVLQDIVSNRDRFIAFFAREDTAIIGVLTLMESFAIYAGGFYGVIDEMYIAPDFRSQGIGELMLEAVKEFGRQKGWARIDVTAPPEKKWARTVRFYEKNGFEFTGPKLRLAL